MGKELDELKVFVWNVKCAGGSRYGNTTLLEDILEGIKSEELKSDIIILNEFYKLSDYHCFKQELEQAGYSILDDERLPQRNVNQVLIAVSDKIERIEKIEKINPNETNCERMPDFLSVVLQYKGRPFAIIGTRIRWNAERNWNIENGEYEYKITENTFNQRKNEFYELLNIVNDLKQRSIDNILIAGDFNHARICGEEQADLTESEIDEKYDGYLQKVYNYHAIKLELKKIGFKLCTPKKGNSIGSLKLDHIIVPNSWTVNDEEYTFRKGSDHAILTATVKL